MIYIDLDISVDKLAGDHYPTTARSGFLGTKQGKLLSTNLDLIKLGLKPLSEGALTETEFKKVGNDLFNALFAGAIGAAYQQAIGHASAENDTGVRLRLSIASPEIADLPWELLYDPDRDCFLAISTETLLTRYSELGKAIKDLPTSAPLNVLVIIPDCADANIKDEKASIHESLAELGSVLEIHTLEGKIGLPDLVRALLLKQFHILHFVGRGGYSDSNGLWLTGDDGKEKLVTAREFSYLFHDYPSMKLVGLYCDAKSENFSAPLMGIARELVELGVPAAIATRTQLADETRDLFIKDFYLKLCLGYEKGRVDIAISHARKRVFAAFPASTDFASTALFMRSPKGVLFDLSKDDAITTVRELHTLNVVQSTTAYNIEQLKKGAGEGSAQLAIEETERVNRLRARAMRFYRKVAVSAVPRVLLMILPLALVVFAASFVRLFDVFRIDAYLAGAVRLWSDVPVKPLHRDVRIIIAEPDNNGDLGSPIGNPAWRSNHADIINRLAATDGELAFKRKPKVIVFDLEFDLPGPNDRSFADAVTMARKQKIPIVYGQRVDNDGGLVGDSLLNPTLKPAFGDNWGDTEVGGYLNVPLLPGKGAYINEYEVASLKPDGSRTPDGLAIVPSLALQAVMQTLGSESSAAQAYFDEYASEVVVRPANGQNEIRIPVFKNAISLEMMLDYAPIDRIRDHTSEYKNIAKWAKSNTPEDKEHLERLLGDAIVLIGFNSPSDRHNVIGDGDRSGVEIHANAVSNILNGYYIRQLPRSVNLLVILAMVTLGVLLQTVLKKWMPKPLSISLPYIKDVIGAIPIPWPLAVVVILYLLIAYLLYSRSHVSFDMSYHVAALLFGYWLIAIYRNRLRRT